MARDLKKLIERLNDLIALDHDAVGGYGAALKHLENQELFARMSEFQADHQRHILELSAVVRGMGGEPRQGPDLKGVMAKAFTDATSRLGDTAALQAMQGNELLANATYDKALREEWPLEVRDLIARNYTDERRHLQYIQDALKSRFYEEGAGAAT
jgi:uncharacterized protein (TIGR02284 family)